MSYQSVKSLLSKGVSRPTLFQVLIPGISRGAQDQLTFLCKSASIPEVAVISGHKDARMLFRYTHLRAKNIIVKLG